MVHTSNTRLTRQPPQKKKIESNSIPPKGKLSLTSIGQILSSTRVCIYITNEGA